jgi:hypothetical protein
MPDLILKEPSEIRQISNSAEGFKINLEILKAEAPIEY